MAPNPINFRWIKTVLTNPVSYSREFPTNDRIIMINLNPVLLARDFTINPISFTSNNQRETVNNTMR